MEAVFGSGRVNDLFAPETGIPGRKTLTARRKLDDSTADLDALDKTEAQSATADNYRTSAQRRRRVISNVAWVYRREEFNSFQQDPNIKTLDFDSDSVPLWQRIRRASLFVDFVRKTESRIRARTLSLADEMRGDVAAIHGFPVSLFTLSLEKINHILDGALEAAPKPGQTVVVQTHEPGTLRHNLRDLKVSEAKGQLENLAREVGIDLTTGREQPLAQCEGHIVSAFRDLKVTHDQLREDLNGTVEGIGNLEAALRAPPADFQYPKSTPALDKLQGRPALIESTIEEARGEEVDRLRSEFDVPARLGNFQPLMARARDLLNEPRGSLTQLVGHVMSVENAIADYRKKLVANTDLHKAHRGVEALARATGATAPIGLTLQEIEDVGSLSDARKLVSIRAQEHADTGRSVLAGTGISFDRLCAIVAALDAGRDPALEPQEADALVSRNLVQRTYRLGVKP